jgi:hypothetical protein
MPTHAQYRTWRDQGVCGHCGGLCDQPPYVCCSHCYTPKPRPAPLFPGVRANTLEYRRRYQELQQGKQAGSGPQIACCNGAFHPIVFNPLRAGCCGRVLALTQREERTP